MLNAVLCCALVLGMLAGLFTIARYARGRGCLSAELSRKVVHVGMGMVCMSFPWLFSSPAPVLALAVGAGTAFLALRTLPMLRSSYGCVLHDVGRDSYGEFAFIAGIAGAFVLAHGSAIAYVVPVAVLTFADTLAALVGIRFGTRRFKGPGGTKTLEGSGTFFAVAVACVAIPLTLAHSPDALLVASLTGAALMLVEALSWAGLDNFAIPVLGGLLLRTLATGAG